MAPEFGGGHNTIVVDSKFTLLFIQPYPFEVPYLPGPQDPAENEGTDIHKRREELYVAITPSPWRT